MDPPPLIHRMELTVRVCELRVAPRDVSAVFICSCVIQCEPEERHWRDTVEGILNQSKCSFCFASPYHPLPIFQSRRNPIYWINSVFTALHISKEDLVCRYLASFALTHMAFIEHESSHKLLVVLGSQQSFIDTDCTCWFVGSLDVSQPYGPPRPATRIALHFYCKKLYLTHYAMNSHRGVDV
jgi:hypothetical protein